MQKVAGGTAQDYNRRKEQHGAFCEDRRAATAGDGAFRGGLDCSGSFHRSCLI